MTSPLADGPDPQGPDRRALESYPEFFSYPARSDADQPRVPAARGETPAEAERIPSRLQVEHPELLGESAKTHGGRPASSHGPRVGESPSTEPPANWSAFGNEPSGRSPGAGSASQAWLADVAPSPEPRSPRASRPRPSETSASAATRPPAAADRTRAGHAATAVPGRGRRRAKRSLASTLWPFHAMRRPRPAAPSKRIRSRSTAATVWRKLKADRAAVFGGYAIVVLILLAVCAPLVTGLFGVDPTTPHPALTDATFGPHGSFGGMSWAHPLGVDQRMGRDVLARLLFGARVSLLIAFGATVLGVGLGAGLGVVAGYLGGRVDMVVMRVADVFLAFPLLLFALGLTGALADEAFGLSGNSLRIAIMIFVMGFFNWPYLARIVRAEVLSLREREFVDAARAMGAGTWWVVWRELMPNLMAPILVYATLLIPANIIFEAGLSALGIGLDPPAASWGQMMTDAVATVYTDPAYLIVPGMAVFITVLAFNLFGDGLRDALDPTAQ